ncbi:MAG: flagellar filament capping protein FliD [Proteobacteria bacterium]|nr:flagellar filament capping protein FliD [Pseudomonadota bacterium]
MSGVTFSGLSSGIDSAKIIEQLLYLERTPVRQMEQTKSNYQNQLSIVQSINSKLQALQTKSKEMDTLSEFLSYSTSSTDEDEVTATALGTASPGVYKVEVLALAKAERAYSEPYEDKELADAAGNGNLKLTIDSVETNITIEDTDTLEDIVGKINSSAAEVSASLLSTTEGYRIQITGNNTGTDNDIIFEEGGTLSLNFDGNVYQSAQNASLKVDDYPISSADNEVDDAITGLTLSLKDETETTVDIAVLPDTAGIKTKVNEFVSSYNEILSLIHEEFKFTGEAKSANRLAGDSTLRSVQQQLGTTISSSLTGLTGTFSALSQIGISTNTDGTLSVDSDDLDTAIASDTAGVGQLFAGTSDNSANGIADQIYDLVDTFVDYSDGVLTAKVSGINLTISNLTDSITRYESRVTSKEEQLRKQFMNLELTVSNLTTQSNFLSSQSFLW